MSRVHKVGTIYSRMEALIRKEHIRGQDIPVWFDVYRQFPPKYEPYFKREVPNIRMKDILYPEDNLRAKIHKSFPEKFGVVNLIGEEKTNSQELLRVCQEYISKGTPENDAIQKLKDDFCEIQT